MGPESGFKPMAFLTVSGICHGLCVAALGLAPSSHLPQPLAPGGNEAVEVAMNEPAAAASSPAPAAVPAPASLPAKKIAQPKIKAAKKIVHVDAAVAPTKDVIATEAPKSEDTVAVAPTPTEELSNDVSNEDLKPVKESAPAGVVAAEESPATPEDGQAPAEETPAAAIVAPVATPAAEAPSTEEVPPTETEQTPGNQTPTEGLASDDLADNGAVAPAAAAAAAAGSGSAAEPTTAQAIGNTRSFQSLTQKAGNRAPEYPIEARAQSRQGNVELLYFVNKDGVVEQPKIATSSGHEDLDQAALSTISNYRFVPGQEGWTRHAVNFSLKGETALKPARLRTMGAQGR